MYIQNWFLIYYVLYNYLSMREAKIQFISQGGLGFSLLINTATITAGGGKFEKGMLLLIIS